MQGGDWDLEQPLPSTAFPKQVKNFNISVQLEHRLKQHNLAELHFYYELPWNAVVVCKVLLFSLGDWFKI